MELSLGTTRPCDSDSGYCEHSLALEIADSSTPAISIKKGGTLKSFVGKNDYEKYFSFVKAVSMKI